MHSEDYGKYENGNKLSYGDFQKYLDTAYEDLCIDIYRDIIPQIKVFPFIIQKIVTDTFRAVHKNIDPHKRINTFELFGYDFMIDSEFKVYLIEVNTNPCLEASSALLGRLISSMLDNAFSLVLDPIFPGPDTTSYRRILDNNMENNFVLVFDEKTDIE